jgi:hypothetical protein
MTNPITLDEMEAMSQDELATALGAGRIDLAALRAERGRRTEITDDVTNSIRSRMSARASLSDSIAATEAETPPTAA